MNIQLAALFLLAFSPGIVRAQAPPETSVTYQEGKLSVRIRNAPVRTALEEVARRTSVRFSLAETVENASISAELTGVALDTGLRLLLSGYDTFFYYGGTASSPVDLRAVWVYPKGTASRVQPVPLEAWAGAKELEAALSDSDPDVRRQAYDALMSRPDRRSRELLIQALRGSRERDEALRQRIFSAAMAKGAEIPPDVLAELARADSSEQIRWMALDALSQDSSAGQAAQAALTDASPVVRQKAGDILSMLAAERLRSDGVSRPSEQQP